MLSLQEYREDLLQFVKVTAESQSEGTVGSFVKVCADILLETEVIPDYELCFYSGIGKWNKALRIDAYAFDDFDGTMYMLAANYDGGKTPKTITRTEARQIFERTRAFAEEAFGKRLINNIEISTPVYDLICLIRDSSDKIRKFKILLITDKVMSERISELELSQANEIPVEFSICDIARFYRIYSSATVRDELEIDFCDYTQQGIPCLEASDAITEDCKSYLCIISGNALSDIYDRYGSCLLEGNVRSFLSLRGGVNKSIRRTILAEPDKFFVYNNGISATATDVVIKEKLGQKYVAYVKDLQIVNGGQTTASLSSARYKDKASLEGIFVQMKLTLVKQDNASEIIPNISRSSNSQNKVSEADFFSNHPFHVRLEEISRRIFAPATAGVQYETHWYYERARGQYTQAQMKMTRAEKARFAFQNPKKQVITKTDLAKVINSWKQLPHIVSKGAQTNFVHFAKQISSEWDKHDTYFHENYFKEAVALTILFRHLEKIVPIQHWYEKGYRANIVTYSIASLACLIEKNFPDKVLDLQRIWNQQEMPEVVEKQLISITKQVFEAITDETRETVNVTQWCKREKCWKFVQAMKIQVVDGLEDFLCLKIEHKGLERQARKDQSVDNSINSQIQVLNLGEDHWKHLLEWAQIRSLVSLAEISLLKKVSKMSKGLFPNDKQCDKLLKVRDRLLGEGFAEPIKGDD
ncbi:AIPR family protein [Peptococcaceae bacterium]|nr:AIPR family protein [Peptococcaceae bacterium]